MLQQQKGRGEGDANRDGEGQGLDDAFEPGRDRHGHRRANILTDAVEQWWRPAGRERSSL
eukprot:3263511-Pyramimonas_sp.AAC.1